MIQDIKSKSDSFDIVDGGYLTKIRISKAIKSLGKINLNKGSKKKNKRVLRVLKMIHKTGHWYRSRCSKFDFIDGVFGIHMLEDNGFVVMGTHIITEKGILLLQKTKMIQHGT